MGDGSAHVGSQTNEALQVQEVTFSAPPAMAVQSALQSPQEVGEVRSVSQPLVTIESQLSKLVEPRKGRR